MIGRGIQGRPWLIADIAGGLEGQNTSLAPTGPQLIDLIISHYEDILAFYGVELGLKNARKHLGWYLDQIEDASEVRAMVLREKDPRSVIRLLRSLDGQHSNELMAA